MTAIKEAIGTTYHVDTEKSSLVWTGDKLIGSGHTGSIKLKEGSFQIDGTEVAEGQFIIDTTSITNTDLTDKNYNDNLVGHLKSEDFFSVEKFPEAAFTINKSEYNGFDDYKISGDLTIKGITHEVSFPAKIQNKGNEVEVKALITIDRTKYDIKYGSNSFFSNLGDKVIKNDFIIDLHLMAHK